MPRTKTLVVCQRCEYSRKVTVDPGYCAMLVDKHSDVFEWQMRFREKAINKPLLDKATMLIINNSKP